MQNADAKFSYNEGETFRQNLITLLLCGADKLIA